MSRVTNGRWSWFPAGRSPRSAVKSSPQRRKLASYQRIETAKWVCVVTTLTNGATAKVQKTQPR
jgi:hypothetical protein